MNYYSTNNRNERVDFRTAILQGLATDKGLYMPSEIPVLESNIIMNLPKLDFQEIAFIIAQRFVGTEISSNDLSRIINSSISFESPLRKLDDQHYVLELFHGPTLAFKDFGARFMARTMEHLMREESKELTILVATSGDTGSAVANGFLNVEGINVVVLYPKGKISEIQKKQITTLNNNISAVEINGTFDDCQSIVKQAFVDDELKGKIKLSSANSINIGRLIPQSFYYFEAFKQLEEYENVVFSVPSGNLGNLTAGLIASKMGLPVQKFIAATNANDVFTQYIHSGKYLPRKSSETISNAMDVGAPSNLARIIDLYGKDHYLISKIIYSKSFTDELTIKKIKNIYKDYGYIIDPHGAVGYLALESYTDLKKFKGVILETAHPAKFIDVFTQFLDFKPEIPERLAKCLSMESRSTPLPNNYDEFKSFLIN